MKLRNNDDDPARDATQPRASEAPNEGQADDTEGHMFLPNDPSTARALAQGRSADIERQMRDRQRQKEARPNKR